MGAPVSIPANTLTDEPTMRLRDLLPFAALAATVPLVGCHPDYACAINQDCASQGTDLVCVPDNDGWGHCVTAVEVYGPTPDAGTATGTDAGLDAGSADAGSPDAGVPDAGIADAGTDAGTEDAGLDAGGEDAGESDAGEADAGPVDAGTSDAGEVDAGLDAGELDAGETDAGVDAGTADDGGSTDSGTDAGSDAG